MVLPGRQDHRGLEERKGLREIRDLQGLKAIRALKDPRAILVNLSQPPLLCHLPCPLSRTKLVQPHFSARLKEIQTLRLRG